MQINSNPNVLFGKKNKLITSHSHLARNVTLQLKNSIAPPLLPGVLKLAIKLVTSMSNPKWVSENYSCLHLPHPPIGRPIHTHAHTVTHTNTPAGTDPPVFFSTSVVPHV